MAVVSQAIEPSGYFHSGWPGLVSQKAVTGNHGGFWGDAAACSVQPPGFDYSQIASSVTKVTFHLPPTATHLLGEWTLPSRALVLCSLEALHPFQ